MRMVFGPEKNALDSELSRAQWKLVDRTMGLARDMENVADWPIGRAGEPRGVAGDCERIGTRSTARQPATR